MNKNILTAAALAGSTFTAVAAPLIVPPGSTVLASWSFEGVTTTNTGTTGTAGAADIGSPLAIATSAATGVHTAATTTFSNPAGNGSTKAFSSNTWAVGDYYQFQLNTVGADNLFVTFGQVGSNTGPRDFTLSYSTDGTTFTNFTTYIVPLSDWTNSTVRATGVQSFDLSAIVALNNQATAYFRLVDSSTTSVNAGTVATGGTDRVDDFTVSDGVVTIATPEPTTAMTLLSGFGMLGLMRRRSRR